MRSWEIRTLLDNIYRKNKEGWEQQRWLGSLIANMFCEKKIAATDLLPFYWDEKEKKDTHVDSTKADDLIKRAKAMEAKMREANT